ncbi:GNAT family N-acetyltransferase [Herbaspirillum rubrisubalbicans]|uniref:GNAT family N-acetyltransferase n=1 Tax=Herbaspirillum rubrisubalbicans TaxID=80842 RepID=A0AAD0U3W9_9BURK|nr:GNAT family N-acetyltransferase [Herbaspirillum rubrisubalbicans]AYR22738.1 GNAT family N-acetyltransferase [Herbaspirillum rubrisubalbicans]
MSIEIASFAEADSQRWDDFCATAINGSFLHSRRFLSYHGDRFDDLSLMIFDSGKLVGVLPAALSPADATQVVSHPGITYGGIVHDGKLVGMKMLAALSAVSEWYRRLGYGSLLYKALPHIYARAPAQDDLYALFRLGATRVRCDLSCAMDLAARLERSERRKRSFKKANASVAVSDEQHLMEPLWQVLEENLVRKHGARPVHTMAELALLRERFPQHITVLCALIDGQVEAGVVFFNSSSVWHAQYIAASAKAYDVAALDAVFEAGIVRAREAGVRYFDFGTSNEEGGMILNDGLYRFKSEFGAAGVAHEFFELRFHHE